MKSRGGLPFYSRDTPKPLSSAFSLLLQQSKQDSATIWFATLHYVFDSELFNQPDLTPRMSLLYMTHPQHFLRPHATFLTENRAVIHSHLGYSVS